MGVDADSVACRDSTSKAENPCQCGRRQAAPGACPPRSCQASSPPKPSPPWAAGRTAGKSQTTVRRTHLGCCGEPGQQSHSSWGTSAALACCFPAGGRVPGVGEEEYPERRSHGISSPPPSPTSSTVRCSASGPHGVPWQGPNSTCLQFICAD